MGEVASLRVDESGVVGCASRGTAVEGVSNGNNGIGVAGGGGNAAVAGSHRSAASVYKGFSADDGVVVHVCAMGAGWRLEGRSPGRVFLRNEYIE